MSAMSPALGHSSIMRSSDLALAEEIDARNRSENRSQARPGCGDAVKEDPSRLQNVIFHLLTVLLEHEANKDLGVASRRREKNSGHLRV